MDELEPTGVVGPLKTGLRIVRGVQRWIEGPDRGVLYRDHYEEWIGDLARRLAEHAKRGVGIAERLDALEQDRERVLVLGNYGLEAWREAVDRRRAMLGDAAEALIFSELTAAEVARVERTIRMLDPEDLELLVQLSRLFHADDAVDPQFKRHFDLGVAQLRNAGLKRGHYGGAALVASGCVRAWDFETEDIDKLIDEGEFKIRRHAGALITKIGELVLGFMGRAQ